MPVYDPQDKRLIDLMSLIKKLEARVNRIERQESPLAPGSFGLPQTTGDVPANGYVACTVGANTFYLLKRATP